MAAIIYFEPVPHDIGREPMAGIPQLLRPRDQALVRKVLFGSEKA